MPASDDFLARAFEIAMPNYAVFSCASTSPSAISQRLATLSHHRPLLSPQSVPSSVPSSPTRMKRVESRELPHDFSRHDWKDRASSKQARQAAHPAAAIGAVFFTLMPKSQDFGCSVK
jgi:hypothetical protein